MVERQPNFLVETQSEYTDRLIRDLGKNTVDRAILGTMIIDAPLYSKERQLLTNLEQQEQAQVEVRYDEAYTKSMSCAGNRNVKRWYPLVDSMARLKRDVSAITIDKTLEDFADILVGVHPRFKDCGTNAKWLRRIASQHLLQPLGVVHAKYAAVDNAAIILTGNFVPNNMNNLALTINNPSASDFLVNAPLSEDLSRVGYMVERLDAKTSLVLDYGNYGQPAQLPKINRLAEAMIDPKCETETKGGKLANRKPTKIYFISQYMPDGKLLEALKRAEQEYDAEVVVPLQPKGDYRLQALGYHTLFANFQRQVAGSNIATPYRPKPSHIKCLIGEYDDGTKSMLFGTDNFGTTINKFVRNTELALYVDHAEPGEDGHDLVEAVLGRGLRDTGELTD